MNCKLTCCEYCAEIAWFSGFEIHDLNQVQLIYVFGLAAFSMVRYSATVFTCACGPLEIT